MIAKDKIGNTVKKIVIIGGGFAGINLALKLGNSRHYQVVLVDKNNYNFFPPLIYQVATGFLETSSISYPFRKLFRKKDNIHFRHAELLKVDTDTHTCYLNNGIINYDFLVFASGTTTNYFGNENIVRNAIPMKTINDALHMRNVLLQTLEQACLTDNPALRKKLLTIVVAGGGSTGVEVSGVLAELRSYILAKDYPELKNDRGDIYLVDGGPRLLAQMSEQSHAETYQALQKLGVKTKLNVTVKDFYNNQVFLSSGEVIETKSLIWTAGVIARTFDGIPATSLGKGKRMIVNEYNKIYGIGNVYAIGDTCIQNGDAGFPDGHPQVAQVAIQQGKRLAKNFLAMSEGKILRNFRYIDKGSMAIVGRNKAVVDLYKPVWHFGGFIALLMWLFIHLSGLINYHNRLLTLYNWIAAYFTRDQSLRMIIRPQKEEPL
jgi:NADH:ubiquinone reductase (H+-translocating)